MPIPLPDRHRSKTVPADTAIDWLTVWALSMGFAALVLAAIAYFSIGDNNGAAFILGAGAAIVGLALYASSRSERERP